MKWSAFIYMLVDIKLNNNSISCLYLNKSKFKHNICKIKYIFIIIIYKMVIITYIWALLKVLSVVYNIHIIYYIKIVLLLTLINI